MPRLSVLGVVKGWHTQATSWNMVNKCRPLARPKGDWDLRNSLVSQSGRVSTESFEGLVGTLKLVVQFVPSAERKWGGIA